MLKLAARHVHALPALRRAEYEALYPNPLIPAP